MAQTYQKQYPEQDILELLSWFKSNFDRLPDSLPLAPGMNIPDLKQTVKNYLEFVQKQHQIPAFAAQVLHLFRIRERLQEEGF